MIDGNVSAEYRRLADSVASGDVVATLVPVDPARGSWFALWDPAQRGGLIAPSFEDLANDEIEVLLPRKSKVERILVPVARLPLPQAIEFFAALPRTAPAHASMHAWASVVRAALGLVARGRLMPWVSPLGWDTWRVDPLDHDHVLHVEALARALPAVAHCLPSGPGPDSISDPVHIVRFCFDAVGDRMVRGPAAPIVTGNPIFSHRNPTRVRHLRPWVRDLAAEHCASTGLVLQMHPPEDDGDWWRIVFRLRSRLDPSLIVDAEDVWDHDSDLVHRFGDQAEIDLLLALRRAGTACPLLEPALAQREPTGLDLSNEELDEFLDSLDGLQRIGVDVRWPSAFLSPTIDRRLVAKAEAPEGHLRSFFELEALLQVDWEFLLDGHTLTTKELAVLAEAKRSVVPIRGRWVRLDPAARARLLAPPPDLRAADVLAGLVDGEIETGDGVLGERVKIRADRPVSRFAREIQAIDGSRFQAAPAGFGATLRPYQEQGLAWLIDVCDKGVGGCLADDMGLGKTVQVLALHLHRGGPTLVVCPTSLLGNWEREAAKFAPAARVRRYHGPNRTLEELEPGDLILTTYGVIRSDAELLGALDWDVVIADEAQQAKNPHSRTAKSLRQIPATARIALTGTPVENRLAELWSIFDWAVPRLFRPLEEFNREFAIPIERDGSETATRKLHRTIKPYFLRRRKSDPGIAPELPPKTERNVVVPLTEEQISLYKATTAETLFDIAENDGITRHGLVLKLLTALKQITNHPAHYLGESGPLPGRSGKLTALDELVDLAAEQDEPILVFTQYVAMGDLLVEHLRSRGVEVGFLHGGQTVGARQDLVDRFQAADLPVLILSLRAGGTGLNLTAAGHVVHFDRWWNPAVEDQATDRAHRIGQQKSVTVHRLITQGTVEDRVAELLDEKRALADRVVGGGESWIGRLDDQALEDLIALRLEGVA